MVNPMEIGLGMIILMVMLIKTIIMELMMEIKIMVTKVVKLKESKTMMMIMVSIMETPIKLI